MCYETSLTRLWYIVEGTIYLSYQQTFHGTYMKEVWEQVQPTNSDEIETRVFLLWSYPLPVVVVMDLSEKLPPSVQDCGRWWNLLIRPSFRLVRQKIWQWWCSLFFLLSSWNVTLLFWLVISYLQWIIWGRGTIVLMNVSCTFSKALVPYVLQMILVYQKCKQWDLIGNIDLCRSCSESPEQPKCRNSVKLSGYFAHHRALYTC